MSDFKIAEKATGGNEGGYANNPNDKGKETFAGIASVSWPNWEGWPYIHKYIRDWELSDKKMSLAKYVNSSARVSTEPIMGMVSRFYEKNFWNSLKAGSINDQQVSNSYYDFGVNSGVNRAIRYLQDSVNELGCKVESDGLIGTKTLQAVNSVDPKKLLSIYNNKREDFYRGLAKQPSQAAFLGSWLSRLKPYKLILLFFFCTAIFTINGCGTRKVLNKSIKTSETGLSSNVIESGKSIKESDKSGYNQTLRNDKNTTQINKKVTEKLDSLGRVKERVTEENIKNTVDKSQKIKNMFRDFNRVTDSVFNIKTYSKFDIRKKESQHQSESKKSNRFFLGVGIGIAISVCLYFVYVYLKRKFFVIK